NFVDRDRFLLRRTSPGYAQASLHIPAAPHETAEVCRATMYAKHRRKHPDKSEFEYKNSGPAEGPHNRPVIMSLILRRF
ncbi:MAG: hypothetical protein IK118_03140, partial [Clostridia bacterium]|nr:hypothetical protein [Clostridia bacterium]